MARASSSGGEPGSTACPSEHPGFACTPGCAWFGARRRLLPALFPGQAPPQHPLGPQPWAGTAMKALHSHAVGWMCPWLRVQSLRREEVAKGELCHQWERLGEKRGMLRKVTMLRPQGAWLCDKRTPRAACSQSGVQWKLWPGAWEAQRSQRLFLPTCHPRSSTTTRDQAGPLP